MESEEIRDYNIARLQQMLEHNFTIADNYDVEVNYESSDNTPRIEISVAKLDMATELPEEEEEEAPEEEEEDSDSDGGDGGGGGDDPNPPDEPETPPTPTPEPPTEAEDLLDIPNIG